MNENENFELTYEEEKILSVLFDYGLMAPELFSMFSKRDKNILKKVLKPFPYLSEIYERDEFVTDFKYIVTLFMDGLREIVLNELPNKYTAFYFLANFDDISFYDLSDFWIKIVENSKIEEFINAAAIRIIQKSIPKFLELVIPKYINDLNLWKEFSLYLLEEYLKKSVELEESMINNLIILRLVLVNFDLNSSKRIAKIIRLNTENYQGKIVC